MAAKKIDEYESTSTHDDNIQFLCIAGGVSKLMSLEDILQKTLRIDKPSEINAVSTKINVADSDLMLIEDAADFNAKKKCTKSQFLVDVTQVTSGTTDPASTPGKLGQIYIDTATPAVWISKGIASSSDWIKIS